MGKLLGVVFMVIAIMFTPIGANAYDVVGLFLNFPENGLDDVSRIDLFISARPDFETDAPAYKDTPHYIGTILEDFPEEDDYQGALGLDWQRQAFSGGVISYVGGVDPLQSGSEVVVDGYVYENILPEVTDVVLTGYPGVTQFTYFLWMTDVPVQITPLIRITVDVWKILVEPDNTPPVIFINGVAEDDQVEWTEGFAYQDEGITAVDNAEGDVTADIVSVPADPNTIDTVNANTGDIFLITYDVQDSTGNVAETRTRTVVIVDDRKPIITLNGDADVTVVRDTPYVDSGATATDFEEGDLGPVVGSGVVDTSTVGDYIITYDVSDSKGNNADQVIRTVHVVDDPPIISLIGNSPMQVVLGRDFNDPGVTALDDHDGDISSNIVVGGDVVDTETLGTYIITYDVTDSYNNAADQVTRTVSVVEAPPGGGGGGGGCFISVLAGFE